MYSFNPSLLFHKVRDSSGYVIEVTWNCQPSTCLCNNVGKRISDLPYWLSWYPTCAKITDPRQLWCLLYHSQRQKALFWQYVTLLIYWKIEDLEIVTINVNKPLPCYSCNAIKSAQILCTYEERITFDLSNLSIVFPWLFCSVSS